MHGVHHDGTRLGAFLLEERLSLHTLGVRHGDSAQDGVCPVYVAVDPVHCQPVGGLEVLADDSVIGGEAGGSVDMGTVGGGGETERRVSVRGAEFTWGRGWEQLRGSPVDLPLGQVRPVDSVAGHLHV